MDPSLSPQSLSDRIAGLTFRDRRRLGRSLERAQPGSDLGRLAEQVTAAEALRARRAGAVPPISYPAELPVSERRGDIMQAIRDHQVVVVAGATGSGKTTQIPKMCLELGRGVDGMIGHTQPRRIAARTVAERLADELSVPLGGPVGYAVRFTDVVGDTTLVKVMTDGILLAEIRRDRQLSAYDTVIVDEAHERSLNIDFLLGYLARLLPDRPDLKLIVTSATIDTQRFAEHFGAPVVEVSGRTYPVEIRYRPLDEPGERDSAAGVDRIEDSERGEGRDLNQAICEAVAEAADAGPGDVLVFCPGERDIRDAAEALRTAGPPDIDILPLYARLSAAEQHRVFKPHPRRRVVLATNVAETSLTVPGVRFVVDTGLARISRYSHRTKVQRLPIERVSRASADQRAGRCGRVGPGVCIRLYSEADHESREQFTDPEILRTNLASVILQMATIGLGEIEDFPFIDPPDRRSITDGRALLEELGALERTSGGLQVTAVGRALADLPIDPRLGRMVIEAGRRDCLREVTIIAAAMSIQDPRERPAEKAEEAAHLHRRFEHPDSDFLTYVALWDHLARIQAELSGNQFRRRCRAEFLNALRVREWQDVAGQIRRVGRAQGASPNREPAGADQVHQAMLSGLLAHIGMRDRAAGDYRGARNSRWQIGRPSALTRRPPAWAMAGELVETGRTWARTVARIEPAWAERAGAHLLRYSYSEAWWDPERADAMTEERATLYGLPVVAARPARLARIDPAEARRLFVQHALVEGEWTHRLPPLERTAAKMASIRALEERVRRRDLVAGEEARFEFYEARVPAGISSGARFDRWWRRAAQSDPGLLDVPMELLLDRQGRPVDVTGYPDIWRHGDLDLRLRYRFEPGADDDGVTVEVPLGALNRVDPAGFEWHVRGYRPELLLAMVRTAPKPVRRALGPAPDVVGTLLSGCGPEDGPVREVVSARLARMSGQPVGPAVWEEVSLPEHLTVRFEVVDRGKVVGAGRDLRQLRVQLREPFLDAVARVAPELVRHGSTRWDFGDIPRLVTRDEVVAYPALDDEGNSVGVVLVESPAVQADAMWRGTRRLLRLVSPVSDVHLQRRLTNGTKLALARSATTVTSLLDDCATAVVDQIIVAHGGPVYTAAEFEKMADESRRQLGDRVARVATIAGGVLAGAELVLSQADRVEARHPGGPYGPALADVRAQVGELVRPGFVTDSGTGRLRHVLRYLDAASRRLDRLPGDHGRDAQRQAVVTQLSDRYDRLLERLAGGGAPGMGAGIADIRWMIEELRVSLWAQQLGTPTPVSAARIARSLDRLGG